MNPTESLFMAQASTQPTPAASPPVADAKPPIRPLEQRRMKLICSSASDLGNYWAIIVPAGVTVETILQPEFWANVADKLRPADSIEATNDSLDFLARFFVRSVGRARVSLALIQDVQFDALSETSEPAAHRIKFGGPHNRWCVERIADGKTIKENLETREDAESALKGIERATDRKIA
jgi:hypothetical protein